MKRFLNLLFVIFIGVFFISASVSNESEKMRDIKELDLSVKTQDIQFKSTVKPDLNFGKIPLYFITNKGQVNKKAKFYAKASRYTLWLTREGLVFDSTRQVEEGKQTTDFRRQRTEDRRQRKRKFARDVSRLFFLNANKSPRIVPVEESKLKVNYFIGNDPSKWHCDVPTSQAVLYKNLYKNIDLKVYGIEKQIEYDWIVKPGGNPGDIRFEYKNVKGTRIDNEGNLLIETDFGVLIHKKPVAYQKVKEHAGVEAGLGTSLNERKDVNVRFKKIRKNIYGFEVGEYDKLYELIIDPVVLAYSTYLGGRGHDFGYGIAVDSSGGVFVTGYTGGTNFPVLNQYQKKNIRLGCFCYKDRYNPEWRPQSHLFHLPGGVGT
jgi:hypothetical protein